MTNLQEFHAGTDPEDPASVLRLDPAGVTGDQLALRFLAVSNRSYTVQTRSSLNGTDWETWLDIEPGSTNRILWLTNTISPPGRYLRVVTPRQP
jgi:hypothetical protein